MESTTSRSKGQRRWPYLTIILALVIALLGVLIWGLDRENRRANRARQVTSLLTQSYYELVDGVGSLNNDLMKLMVSASPGTNVALLSRLSAQAQSAAESLAALPGGHGALQGAMGFLNQVGDMSGSLLSWQLAASKYTSASPNLTRRKWFGMRTATFMKRRLRARRWLRP